MPRFAPTKVCTRVGAICTSADPSIDGGLLLATHAASKELRLYRVRVDFPNTRFQIRHLKTVHECSPQDQDTGRLSATPVVSCRLSHLEIIPAGPETHTRGPTNPFVLAVFSHAPGYYHEPNLQDEPFSILSRWEYRNSKPHLHPSFEQLLSKKPGAPPPTDLSVSLKNWFFQSRLSHLTNCVSLKCL